MTFHCPHCKLQYARPIEHCGLDGSAIIELVEDPLLGTRIDRYDIFEVIGGGGQGLVYRARHALLGTERALKIPYGELVANREFAERFRREARAAAKIDHPNVVRTYDLYETAERLPMLAMELLRGETLTKVMATETVSADDAALIIRDLADGLATVHRLGLVHRDVKPSNVMIVDDGDTWRVKLLDFGIVREDSGSSALTTQGQIMGTITYMAPEQIRGEGVGPAADLYALGVLLHELLTGSPPFIGANQSILLQKLSGESTAVPHPSGLGDIAARLLASRPEDRYPSALALIDAIDALDDQPTLALDAAATHTEFAPHEICERQPELVDSTVAPAPDLDRTLREVSASRLTPPPLPASRQTSSRRTEALRTETRRTETRRTESGANGRQRHTPPSQEPASNDRDDPSRRPSVWDAAERSSRRPSSSERPTADRAALARTQPSQRVISEVARTLPESAAAVAYRASWPTPPKQRPAARPATPPFEYHAVQPRSPVRRSSGVRPAPTPPIYTVSGPAPSLWGAHRLGLALVVVLATTAYFAGRHAAENHAVVTLLPQHVPPDSAGLIADEQPAPRDDHSEGLIVQGDRPPAGAVAPKPAPRAAPPAPKATQVDTSARFTTLDRLLQQDLDRHGLDLRALPWLAGRARRLWLAWRTSDGAPPADLLEASYSILHDALLEAAKKRKTDDHGRDLGGRLGRHLAMYGLVHEDIAVLGGEIELWWHRWRGARAGSSLAALDEAANGMMDAIEQTEVTDELLRNKIDRIRAYMLQLPEAQRAAQSADVERTLAEIVALLSAAKRADSSASKRRVSALTNATTRDIKARFSLQAVAKSDPVLTASAGGGSGHSL